MGLSLTQEYFLLKFLLKYRWQNTFYNYISASIIFPRNNKNDLISILQNLKIFTKNMNIY